MRCIVHRDQNIYQCSLEFQILDEYLAYIEGSLSVTLQDVVSRLHNKEEHIEYDDGQTFGYHFDGLVLPDSAPMIVSRFLYNNYFLSLWATYETGLKEIAMFLSLALGLDNFEEYKAKKGKKKKNIIVEIFKYFRDVCNISMPTINHVNQQYLNNLYMLRNTMAHANGRIKDISSSKRNKELLKWILKQPEIIVSENNWILLNNKFDRGIYGELSCSFEKLYHLAYERAPNVAPRPVNIFVCHY